MTQNSNITTLQQKFINEFVQTLDPEQSARKAGYTRKDAARRARELLANPKILSAINEKIDSLALQLQPPKAFFAKKFLDIIHTTTAEEAVLDRSGGLTGKTKIADAASALRALDALNKLFSANSNAGEETGVERSFTINNLNTDLI